MSDLAGSEEDSPEYGTHTPVGMGAVTNFLKTLSKGEAAAADGADNSDEDSAEDSPEYGTHQSLSGAGLSQFLAASPERDVVSPVTVTKTRTFSLGRTFSGGAREFSKFLSRTTRSSTSTESLSNVPGRARSGSGGDRSAPGALASGRRRAGSTGQNSRSRSGGGSRSGSSSDLLGTPERHESDNPLTESVRSRTGSLGLSLVGGRLGGGGNAAHSDRSTPRVDTPQGSPRSDSLGRTRSSSLSDWSPGRGGGGGGLHSPKSGAADLPSASSPSSSSPSSAYASRASLWQQLRMTSTSSKRVRETERTAVLMQAVARNDRELALAAIREGSVDIMAQDTLGNGLLNLAIQNDMRDVVQFLLRRWLDSPAARAVPGCESPNTCARFVELLATDPVLNRQLSADAGLDTVRRKRRRERLVEVEVAQAVRDGAALAAAATLAQKTRMTGSAVADLTVQRVRVGSASSGSGGGRAESPSKREARSAVPPSLISRRSVGSSPDLAAGPAASLLSSLAAGSGMLSGRAKAQDDTGSSLNAASTSIEKTHGEAGGDANDAASLHPLCILDGSGRAPIHVAVSGRDGASTHMLRMVLTCPGIDINVCSSSGNTPLHYFCERATPCHDLVQLFCALIRRGALITALNNTLETPLHVVTLNNQLLPDGRLLLFRCLLEAGSDTTWLTKRKQNILHYCIFMDRLEFVLPSLRAGAPLEPAIRHRAVGTEPTVPLLEMAVKENRPAIAKVMKEWQLGMHRAFKPFQDHPLDRVPGSVWWRISRCSRDGRLASALSAVCRKLCLSISRRVTHVRVLPHTPPHRLAAIIERAPRAWPGLRSLHIDVTDSTRDVHIEILARAVDPAGVAVADMLVDPRPRRAACVAAEMQSSSGPKGRRDSDTSKGAVSAGSVIVRRGVRIGAGDALLATGDSASGGATVTGSTSSSSLDTAGAVMPAAAAAVSHMKGTGKAAAAPPTSGSSAPPAVVLTAEHCLPDLAHLSFHGCAGLTGAFLKPLAGTALAARLRTLDVSYCAMLDNDFMGELVTVLPNLSWLRLAGLPRLTSRGLSTVAKRMLHLTQLDLRFAAHAGANELRALAPLAPRLRSLNLLGAHGAAATDAGVAALCVLSELRALDLSGSSITDQGVATLCSQLPRLHDFRLCACPEISPVSLAHVASATSIHRLAVDGCDSLRLEEVVAFKSRETLRSGFCARPASPKVAVDPAKRRAMTQEQLDNEKRQREEKLAANKAARDAAREAALHAPLSRVTVSARYLQFDEIQLLPIIY